MTTCRSCNAEVVFVPSAKSGKSMILDAAPRKGVVLIEQGHPDWLAVYAVKDPDSKLASVENVYTDHHVTCPAAAEWKGRTR